MTIAIPGINRLPADQRGITLADFLVPVQRGRTPRSPRPAHRPDHARARCSSRCALSSRAEGRRSRWSPTRISRVSPVHRPDVRACCWSAAHSGSGAAFLGRAVRRSGCSGCRVFAGADRGVNAILARALTGSRLPASGSFLAAAAVTGRLAELGWDRQLARRDRRHVHRQRDDLRRRRAMAASPSRGLATAAASGADAVPRRRRDQARARGGRVPGSWWLVGRRSESASRVPPASNVTTPRTGPGLYGPESEAWRLNREAMLLLGAGPRALLLQLAHPQVAAGVEEHSDFRADPWAPAAGHAPELPRRSSTGRRRRHGRRSAA